MNRLSDATFDWMANISIHNSRDNFLASKPQYEEFVKRPFVELLRDLAADFGGVPKVFRPNRDIRFSADKRPYKTNISGYLEGAEATYYLDLSLDGFMAATGYYQMAKDQIAKYRSVLTLDNHQHNVAELRKIISDTGAKGEGLKTVPRGIVKDHPNADLLRFTSLVCSEFLPHDEVVGADLKSFSAKLWKKAGPLNGWLSQHVGPSEEPWMVSTQKR